MSEKVERVPTGIPGLDKIMQGGLVKGSTTLISGSAGTGKTILCAQFLWHGLKLGENCMFITFEESAEDIIKDAKVFGWDFESYEKKGKLIIEYRPPLKTEDLFFFENEIRKYKITRVALDSTSVMSMTCESNFEIRRSLFKLINVLKNTGATSLLTAEIVTGDKDRISRFGVEEFVADGAIALYSTGVGEGSYRSLQIIKMRRTKHSQDIHPLEVTNKGLVMHKI